MPALRLFTFIQINNNLACVGVHLQYTITDGVLEVFDKTWRFYVDF